MAEEGALLRIHPEKEALMRMKLLASGFTLIIEHGFSPVRLNFPQHDMPLVHSIRHSTRY